LFTVSMAAPSSLVMVQTASWSRDKVIEPSAAQSPLNVAS
jgi:hypothetical protein